MILLIALFLFLPLVLCAPTKASQVVFPSDNDWCAYPAVGREEEASRRDCVRLRAARD